jgi:hypothetical protein
MDNMLLNLKFEEAVIDELSLESTTNRGLEPSRNQGLSDSSVRAIHLNRQ